MSISEVGRSVHKWQEHPKVITLEKVCCHKVKKVKISDFTTFHSEEQLSI